MNKDTCRCSCKGETVPRRVVFNRERSCKSERLCDKILMKIEEAKEKMMKTYSDEDNTRIEQEEISFLYQVQ